ncbi:MAG: hypothetical protein P8N76_01100 [Pirellulaceae bacterium]|nr:hypothetical protein [Pirellulaceae bacterium]
MVQTEKTNVNPAAGGLGPPRFGLRTMFGLVALFCGCLAAFVAAGPLVGSALLMALVIVATHVAGNAIGSRLRDNAQRSSNEPEDGPDSMLRRPPEASHFAPPTRLSRRAPLGWFMRIMTGLGCVAGAICGGLTLNLTSTQPLSLTTFAFGSTAMGILGGLFSFWLFSLMQVFLLAWWQADWHGHQE